MVWLDTPGRTAVRLRGRSQGQSSGGGVGQGQGRVWPGAGKGSRAGTGTVLVCDRLLRPLLMETVLLDYVEVPEDGCFLEIN